MKRMISLILILILLVTLGTVSCKIDSPPQESDDTGGKKLAVIFPGMGYNIDRPLLFYSRELLEKEGYEILSIEWNDIIKTRYDQASELLDKIEFDEYEDVIFVSKSIGSEISSTYVVNHNLRVRQIWYTPLQGAFDVCSGDIEEESIIAFIGTKDERSNVYQIKIKAEQLKIELHVYDDCDHSLECKDDSQNQEVLDDVMEITYDFVISERIQYEQRNR